MSSNRKCAYCDSQEGLTQEHIFPKFIYSREASKGHEKQLSRTITTAGEKAVQSDLTIGDVCALCNNGFLSQLDEYGAKLYDQFFGFMPQPGERIELFYDFDLLTRWLLKLSYNTARMRKWPAPHLEQLTLVTGYMKGHDPCPSNLRVYVQLITPAKLTPVEKERILKLDGLALDELEPGFRRFNAFWMEGMVTGCLVAMNGYQFYIVFWNCAHARQQMRNSENKFLRHTLGAKRLRPTTTKSVLYPSSLNILDVVKKNPVMMQNLKRGAAWVGKRDTKKGGRE
jgi:hypothetical protein